MRLVCILLLILLVVSTFAVPAQLMNISGWSSAMFVTAHPDDIEGTVGSLVPLLVAQNTTVYYVIFTNGDKGCANPLCYGWRQWLTGYRTAVQIAAQRRLEAYNAASVVGVPQSNVYLLDYEDAMLTSYPEQQPRLDLMTVIRKVRPQVLISWYPYPDFNLQPRIYGDLGYHPDHQCSGKLALDSQFDSSVELLFPMTGPAWQLQEYYMINFSTPTVYLPVPQSAVQAQVNAFLQHKSQYSNATDVTTGLFQLAAATATVVGCSQSYAIAFTAYY